MVTPERYHRGACVLPDWELRITQRCLTDDLSLAAGTDFTGVKCSMSTAL